jgi:cardiolipin synthase
MSAGVKIYRYKPGFNHMKSIIADGKLAMVGTINFDFRSLVHHYECGAVLYKTECMKDILEDFKQMLSVSEEVPANFKPKNFTRLLCAVLKIITPLM